MPKRKNVIRVDSTEVQGKGSYITMRVLKVAEVRDLFRVETANEDRPPEEVYIEAGRTFLDRLEAWNWVDDDGEALPPPTEMDPEELTSLELAFIGQSLANMGREQEQQGK